MKKLLMLLMGCLLLVSMVALAQEGEAPSPPPDYDFGHLVVQLLAPYFVTLYAFAGVNLLITGWTTSYITKFTGLKAQIQSWVISLLLSLIGFYLSIGIFEHYNLAFTLITGFTIGLVSNGFFQLEAVKSILDVLHAKVNKK